MPVFQPLPEMPQLTAESLARHRHLGGNGYFDWLPGGGVIDGTKTRDVFNTTDVTRPQPGLLMGKVTSGGKWAPSVIGVTGAAYASGTSLTISAATTTEILRRIGASGTFKIVGPPAASGVARSTTVTYSGASGTTATITALGANQVERITFNIASTAGNLQLSVQKTDGTFVTTANIAWSATDATYLASINSALDTATGVTGGIVATAISAVDTDLGFELTYSGTGYAGLPWTRAQVALFPTSSTLAYYTPITTAVMNDFVSGSLIMPTDGSETPLSFLPPGYDLILPSNGTSDVPFPHIPVGGEVDTTRLLPAVTDSGLKTWIRDQLNVRGQFIFTDVYDF
jgi:hypothetical protein